MNISPAELDVMNIIWNSPGLGAVEIHKKLLKDKDWNIKTVKTLLSRLVEKQALQTEKQSKRYLYYPLIEQKDFHRAEVSVFAKKMFSGRATPFVAYLAENDELTKNDIEELEQLLEELKK